MNINKNITKDLLYQYYIEENKTLRQVATIFNCSVGTIERHLNKHDIRKPRAAYSDSYKWSQERKNYASEHNPMKNPDIVKRSIQAKVEKYGEDWGKLLSLKSFQTYKERTGFDNPFQDTNNIKNSMIAKYGVPHNNYIPEIQLKRKLSWECVDKELLALKKKATCNIRYGVDVPAQSPYIMEKMKATCLERYGVENIFLYPDLKYNLKSKYSQPNNNFASLLDSYNITYSREYVIKMKSFDFRVNNYLVEINPFATHNSTWGAYGNKLGLDKYYHFNKSKLASDYGFICLHVFD